MNTSGSIPQVPYTRVRNAPRKLIHAARSVAQADVFEIEWESCTAILKDFSARPWLVRFFWSRPVARREARMLHRLAGTPGVPELISMAGPEAILIERIEGQRIPRHRRGGVTPPGFWEQARALIEQMHARGVAHGDLRLKNMLIGEDERPYVIDFATAMAASSPDAGGLSGLLFRLCRRVDQFNLARMKSRYEPDRLDVQERAWLENAPLYLRFGRLLKRRVYRLKKGRFWRKKVGRPLRRALIGSKRKTGKQRSAAKSGAKSTSPETTGKKAENG